MRNYPRGYSIFLCLIEQADTFGNSYSQTYLDHQPLRTWKVTTSTLHCISPVANTALTHFYMDESRNAHNYVRCWTWDQLSSGLQRQFHVKCIAVAKWEVTKEYKKPSCPYVLFPLQVMIHFSVTNTVREEGLNQNQRWNMFGIGRPEPEPILFYPDSNNGIQTP